VSSGREFTGKTVEAATVEAEEALGKSREQLEIQVLSQGSRGVFGLGGEPARILVRDPNAPAAAPAPVAPAPPSSRIEDTVAEQEPEPAQPARPARPPRRERAERVHEAADESAFESKREHSSGAVAEAKPEPPPEALAAAAREILATLLDKMGFDVDVSVRDGEDPVTLDVKGENLGILIGRRGDSLASLQFMVNVILSKEFRTWPRVVIDIQGYRARREQSLNSQGQRVAERVRRNRRPFTLEAMPANDRRIIHLSLRDRNDVETYSIGEGQSRRVVIAPKR